MKLNKQIIFLTLMILSSGVLLINTAGIETKLNSLDSSLSELYDDRLMAESCVFKMNNVIHEKQMILFSAPSRSVSASYNVALKNLDKQFYAYQSTFEKTKLSDAESLAISELKQHSETMQELEILFVNGHACVSDLNKIYENMLNNLEDLSNIQVKEAGLLNKKGHQMLASSFLGLQVDSAMFILLLASIAGLLKTSIRSNRLSTRY